MPDLQLGMFFMTLKKVHSLCLILDVSGNIFTYHITSTLSGIEVFLQLACYINYLLTYLPSHHWH